jgi:transmembrane sensor
MRKNYTQIQNFLDDDGFVKWVVLGKENAWWQRFLVENPAKTHLMMEARRLILEIQKAESLEELHLDQKLVWSKILARLESPESERLPHQPPIRRRYLWQWAAGFVVLAGIGWLVWQNQPTGNITYREIVSAVEAKDHLLEKVNRSDSSLKIILDDGSQVTLDKDSKLSYPAHFGKKQRTVVLTGAAYFEVAKDSSRPFYIYSNELITKVLGTSFRIQAFERDKEVIVQVQTGRVSVYKQKRVTLADPETEGLVLLPNQQAVFSRPDKVLSRRLVAHPTPLVPPAAGSPITRYDEVSASKILRDIEARYGISFIFNDDVLNRCILTTTLGDESLYDALDLICKTIGATYKEVDAQIVIESQGCAY